MDKTTLFTGQPVFSQLLAFIPKSILKDVILKHQTDRYYKRFKTNDHLLTMLYATFHGCKSLREVITGMMACTTRLNHLSLHYLPRRSTLAEANQNRTQEAFADLYQRLYLYFYPDSPKQKASKNIEKRLFIFDATVIELFSEVMKGSGKKPVSGKRKGGVKAHVLIKADEDVARFVHLIPAKHNDNVFMPFVHLPQGSIVTFDRGYYAYRILQKWDKEKITWVTRLRNRALTEVVLAKEITTEEAAIGILKDEQILLGHKDKFTVRRISYKDPLSSKELFFMTNNMRMKASTITGIYKRRWQIELLFKRLKQNYPLKYFLGDSENAIKIQIWCALITDLLIKIVKDKVKRKWAFSNIAGMIRLHLMTYINLIKFLQNPEKALRNYLPQTQLQLSLFPT